MKKVVLSLAGVMAAAAFAPEASALPLFARQTGMACNACHFQHFPMLNGFGRSFKASGFTLMGAQGKVEGDDLSLPETLNMAVLTTAGYTKTNNQNGPIAPGANGNGNGWFVPGTNGEFSLFMGGRVSDFAGALAEIGLLKAPIAAGGGGLPSSGTASVKLPFLWEVADGTRAGVVFFTTDAQGASYGFETLNTGANAVHTMLFAAGDINGQLGADMGAAQYLNTAGAATGAAVVAVNSMGFINFTKFHRVGPADLRNTNAGAGTGAALSSTYARVAGTFDLAGWDTGVGIQSWSGRSLNPGLNGPAAPAGYLDTKAWVIDGQMQGEMGGMPVGFYASYGRAPTSANGNAYNPGALAVGAAGVGVTGNRSSLNIGAEIGVVPEKVTVGGAIRRSKTGNNAGCVVSQLLAGVAAPLCGGVNDTDNGFMLNASYKLAQNVVAQLNYTSASGGAWPVSIGNKQTILSVTTLF